MDGWIERGHGLGCTHRAMHHVHERAPTHTSAMTVGCQMYLRPKPSVCDRHTMSRICTSSSEMGSARGE